MESRREITDFVTTKKTKESEIYKLVCNTIQDCIFEGREQYISVEAFCNELIDNSMGDDENFATCISDSEDKYTIEDKKTKEILSINFAAKHGDICPKLRGIIDLVNEDKEFPHFAVIVNNEITIDDVLAGREYADRLSSRAAALVLRVAALAAKCPLQDEAEDVAEDEIKA